MARRVPEGPPPPPVVQRIRLRYAKRGRLRFVSHRDFARALERALRRAQIPMAYSAGFSPHPKISYVGAAPTGVASEAEYVEIGLAQPRDPEAVRALLDEGLPDGLDVVEAVAAGPGSLAERMEASRWRIELPDAHPGAVAQAVAQLLERDELTVQRVTKDGHRTVDVRGAIVALACVDAATDPTADPNAAPSAHDTPGHPGDTGPDAVPEGEPTGGDRPRAILEAVVRQVTPTVRPDDVIAALRTVAGLALDTAPLAVRLAQGPLDDSGQVTDPLAPDRAAASTAS